MANTINKVDIRYMVRRDMAAVVEIDELCMREPLGESGVLDLLKTRDLIAYVAELDNRVVGFAFYVKQKSPAILDVTAIAVHPDYQRQGIGKAFAAKLVGMLYSKNYPRDGIAATVFESDSLFPSGEFWRAVGYKATKYLKGYVSGEDGIIFTWSKPR